MTFTEHADFRNPAVARCGPRCRAVLLGSLLPRCADACSTHASSPCSGPSSAPGDRRVVDPLQPRALVGAHRRHHPHDPRDHRDTRSSTSRLRAGHGDGCCTSTPSRSSASPWLPGPWPPASLRTECGAHRWSRPLRSPARRGCSSGRPASRRAARISIGGGHRRPSSGCWLRRNDEPKALLAGAGRATPAATPKAAPATPAHLDAGATGRRDAARPQPLRAPDGADRSTASDRAEGLPRASLDQASRMARLSRTRARQHRSRRADRNRLVRSRRRSSCGAGRSDRAGHRSRCTATCSTRRSSAVMTR